MKLAQYSPAGKKCTESELLPMIAGRILAKLPKNLLTSLTGIPISCRLLFSGGMKRRRGRLADGPTNEHLSSIAAISGTQHGDRGNGGHIL